LTSVIDEALFQRNIQAINGQIREAAQNHKLEVTVWVSPGLERPIFDHLAKQYSVCDYKVKGESSGFIDVRWSHASPPRDGPNGPMPPPPPRQADLYGWDLFWLKRRTPKPPT